MFPRDLQVLMFLESCTDVLYAPTKDSYDAALARTRTQLSLARQDEDVALVDVFLRLIDLLPTQLLGGTDTGVEEKHGADTSLPAQCATDPMRR